ncbi:prepilin-type N-terminal cleavage/methylation domain-containing protein [Candidatus Nomurabacteria bacterium]|nr:prepilin-type N-terminal cleavage/methylation domain-containing protein [Candidatus Nomurabacteria bacterium]
MNLKKGFTLIELLVVIAIIGVLATLVLSALNDARNKGADAAVKSNLVNATRQAEIFYSTNTAVPNSYTNICFNGMVGGAKTVNTQLLAAAKALGRNSYAVDEDRTTMPLDVICNDDSTGGVAWMTEAPLKGGGFWCVDSTGKSIKTTLTSISAINDTTCN